MFVGGICRNSRADTATPCAGDRDAGGPRHQKSALPPTVIVALWAVRDLNMRNDYIGQKPEVGVAWKERSKVHHNYDSRSREDRKGSSPVGRRSHDASDVF